MKYFYSIAKERTAEIKIKRSRFIVSMYSVTTMAEAKYYISKISDNYKTANHNCWAYIIGEKGETFHSSDAGEPSGTAGKPMLNSLKKHEMTNIAVVVTRYFGGVKLGIRGLINAYGESVDTAIKLAPLKKIVKLEFYRLKAEYDFAEQLKYQLEQLNADIVNIDYAAEVTIKISIKHHKKRKLEKYLVNLENANRIMILK